MGSAEPTMGFGRPFVAFARVCCNEWATCRVCRPGTTIVPLVIEHQTFDGGDHTVVSFFLFISPSYSQHLTVDPPGVEISLFPSYPPF